MKHDVNAEETISRTDLKKQSAKLIRQNQRFLALNAVAARAQEVLDIPGILEVVGQGLRSLDYWSSIAFLEENNTALGLRYLCIDPELLAQVEQAVTFAARSWKLPLARLPDFTAAIAERQPKYIPDLEAVLRSVAPPGMESFPSWMTTLPGVRRAIAAPLIARGVPLGILTVYANALTLEDLPVVFAFANQTAIAIENARLYTENQRRLQQSDLLHTLTTQLSAELDLPRLLEIVLSSARQLVNAEAGSITLFDERDGYYVVAAVQNLSLEPGEIIPQGQGIVWQAVNKRQVVFAERADSLAEEEHLNFGGCTSAISVPLCRLNHVIGVLTLGTLDPQMTFGQQDSALLEALAIPATIAIENARFYQQAARRAEQLSTLYQTGQMIAAAHSQQETLAVISRAATELLGTTAALIWLVKEQEGVLAYVAGYGPGLESIAASDTSISDGLLGRCVREGRTIICNDLYHDPWTTPADLKRYQAFGSLLLTPLTTQTGIVGVLSTGIGAKGFFHDEHLQLLASFAAQAAGAFEKARLYQEARDAAANIGQLYTDLQHAYETQKDLDKAKDEFITTISHELRTPLTALRGSLSLLKSFGDKLDTRKVREFILRASQGADDLSRLVEQLLEVYRLGETSFTLRMAPVAVDEVIHHSVNLAQQLSSVHPVRFDLPLLSPEEAAKGPLLVLADEIALRQVLANLLSNAIHYSPAGRPVLVRVRKIAAQEACLPGINEESDKGAAILFEVCDQGIGIPTEDQSRLFQRFVRLPGSQQLSVRGTGLGLYISRQLVETMKGRIWFESKLGQGSVFSFVLSVPSSQ